jgi:hypothetical protein
MLEKGKTPNPNNAADPTEGQQPTGKLSFRDYMTLGKSLKAIKDGVYNAMIKTTKFVSNDKDPDKDYLRLEINLPDADNRIVIENRFVSGYFIFEREIKAQLGISDQTIPVPELLAYIVDKPIKVWYSTITSAKDNRKYQNMSFSEPVAAPETTETPKF